MDILLQIYTSESLLLKYMSCVSIMSSKKRTNAEMQKKSIVTIEAEKRENAKKMQEQVLKHEEGMQEQVLKLREMREEREKACM